MRSSFHRNMDLRSWDTSLLTRYASVTAPASKGQMPRRRLRSQTFGLSIIFSLALPLRPVTASAEEKARCRARATRPPVSILTPYGPKALQRAGRLAAYCFNPHPYVVRFALATPPDRTLSPPRHIAEVRTSPPQNGKCAAARARKSLAHASEPAGPSRPATRGPPPGLRFPQTRRSARPFQAPRTRLRLEAAFGGLVLAGRKGRASHRHRSGLKIPARPLSAPATPAKAGHAPCFIGPPALQKSAPEYRRLPATRPPVSLWTPQSRLRASSVTCASMRSF